MWQIVVSHRQNVRQVEHSSGPLEFGRQPPREGIAFLRLDDPHVSRSQLRLEALEGERIRVVNLSQRVHGQFDDGHLLQPGATEELMLPIKLKVGDTWIEVRPNRPAPPPQSEPWHTVMIPERSWKLSRHKQLSNLGEAPTPEQIAQWLETVLSVQRAAAGSNEFYSETARALVDLVGLDHGLVLKRVQRAGQPVSWEATAEYPPPTGATPRWSMTLLKHMVEQRRTLYQSIQSNDLTISLIGVEAVVVSPMFDVGGQIVGALYGLRLAKPGRPRPEIRPLEAQLTQLLAAAVDTGVARQEREAEALRASVQFAQFFSAPLARELASNPRMLEGVDREVTVLFCDVCGFSRLSEQLSPTDTCRLINDCMEHFTDVVQIQEGVLVDYVGDGLLAMWNAPREEPRHAALACTAARAVLGRLPDLNEIWMPILKRPLDVAMGINTGLARVGNIGSRRRLKYGPLGHTVNLASRVQGAARQLNVRITISAATRALLPSHFQTRRLGAARLVGMQGPVVLHELNESEAQRPAAWESFEKALEAFEQGELEKCLRALELPGSELGSVTPWAQDGPSVFLAQQIRRALAHPDRAPQPVLVFDQK